MFFWILALLLKAFVVIFLSTVVLGSFAVVLQERKIWKHPNLPSLSYFGFLKVFVMNIFWMLLCAFGGLMTPLYCIYARTWHPRPWAHAVVERNVAQWLCKYIIAPVEVVGMENIPEESLYKSPAPVFVANHTSQIDAAVVYYLNREWRWIAKSSVMFLPGVGQIMWLSDHVLIDRLKKQSGTNSRTGARNLYIQSNASVQAGIPMFFFPQGTRQLGERLPFKDGAFKIALENKSKLIPVSLDIPLTVWNSWYPLAKAPQPIKITVHPPIETTGKDLETLKKESFDTIYSVLPDYSKQS